MQRVAFVIVVLAGLVLVLWVGFHRLMSVNVRTSDPVSGLIIEYQLRRANPLMKSSFPEQEDQILSDRRVVGVVTFRTKWAGVVRQYRCRNGKILERRTSAPWWPQGQWRLSPIQQGGRE